MTSGGHRSLIRSPGSAVSLPELLPTSKLAAIDREAFELLNALRRASVALERYCQQNSDVTNGAMNARLNNQFTGTLTANAGSTTFSDPRIAFDSQVVPVATTANAAGALSGLYQSTTANGSVTFTHANNAQTDKTFLFTIHG